MSNPGRTSARAGVILDGRYQLDRPVGRGGMGMVFRATQLNLGRTVAVKVLPTDLLERGGEFEARFRREALAISQLQHPNIVQVLDFGRDPHFGLYLVMEYLDGRGLDEVIHEDHPLAPRRAADLLVQALMALEAAHAHAILHRDVKPANMMACNVPGRPDLVKVLDFGVARPLGKELDSWKLTRDGMVCGTPLYMAPEQASAGELDARADVYAVGTVLYEMLAGHLPFDETAPMDCLALKVAEDPPPLRAMATGDPAPEKLRSICMRAIARRPDDRFPDATRFREALEQWLGRTPRGTPATAAGAGAAEGARLSPRGGPLVEDGPTSPSNRWFAGGDARDDEDTEEDLDGPVDLDELRASDSRGGSSVSLSALPPVDPELPPTATAVRQVQAPPLPEFGQRLHGRRELLQEIERTFDEASSSGWAGLLLYGPRGSGRTALLTRVGAQAAVAGWDVRTLDPTGAPLSPQLTLADLLPPVPGSGPQLLLVDGLDRLPEPLVQQLTRADRFPDRPTMLLAGARRPGGVDPAIHRRQLEPLPRSAREALVAEALDEPVVLTGPEVAYPGWLQQRLALDLVRDRLVRDPESGWRYTRRPTDEARDAVLLARERLEALAPTPRELLVAICLSACGLPHELLALVTPEGADPAVGELARLGLIRWAGDRWGPASETVAEAARERLADEVRPLCGRLASACRRAAAARGGLRRRRLAIEEVEFRVLAGQPLEAADALVDVARQDEAVSRPERAVEPLERALELARSEVVWTTRRIGIASRLATALVDAGRPREAMEVIKEVQLRERLDPRYPAGIALARARALDALDHEKAGDALEKASRLAGLARDGGLQVDSRLALAERALRLRDRATASRHAEQASYTGRLAGLDAEERLLLELRIAETLARTGPKGLARKLFDEARGTARAEELPHLAARAALGSSALLLERGDRRRAAELLDRVIGEGEVAPLLRARAALNRGLLHTLRGEAREARRCYRTALGLAAIDGWREGVARAARALGSDRE